MSDTLNTVLGQLEEDLKKLQSARKQVESVVASNQEFAMIVNSLVENTNSLVDKIGTAIEGTIGHFSEKLTESKNAVDKIVEDGVSSFQSSAKKNGRKQFEVARYC
jgi:ABC-type transporter Mla subunit MlaD